MQKKHPNPEPNLNLACKLGGGGGGGNEKGELYLTFPTALHFLHWVIKGNEVSKKGLLFLIIWPK